MVNDDGYYVSVTWITYAISTAASTKFPQGFGRSKLLGLTVTATLSPSKVKAFDLQTGKELWTHQMLGGMALLANDREVFIHDRAAKSKSRLVVVDSQTGEKLRQIDLPLKQLQGILLDNNVIYAIDVKIENVVPGVEPRADNHSLVNAFAASDGKLLWRTPTLRNSQIRSLKIQGNRLFLSSQGLRNEIKSTVRSFPTR